MDGWLAGGVGGVDGWLTHTHTHYYDWGCRRKRRVTSKWRRISKRIRVKWTTVIQMRRLDTKREVIADATTPR